jgi:hypothetical protein
MRGLMLLAMMAVIGCASQPSAPQAPSSTAPTSAVAPSAPAPGQAPVAAADSVEAQRLAAAKNLNMKVIDKDGQQLFCRSNLVTGSHIQRDTTCYTADQLDHMQAQMQRDLDRMTLTPSQGQGLPSH